MKCITEDEYTALVAAKHERDQLRGAVYSLRIELGDLRQELAAEASPRWQDRLIARVTRRPPDFVIGGAERPYLRRWWLTPWRRFTERAKHDSRRWIRVLGKVSELLPNAYLHQFLRSDDDRALHDHPWANVSILLRGSYIEHTISAGGIHHRNELSTGDWRIRLTGRLAHRVELLTIAGHVRTQPENREPLPCWTLFITGPRYRDWGFHCPDEGWIHWKRFTAVGDPGAIGKGCGA